MLTGRGEWALDSDSKLFDGKTESEFMAQSIADVARHYGGIADQKTLDWFNLTQCLAIVWGGRIFVIRSTPRPKAAPKPDLAARMNGAAQHHAPSPLPVNSFDPVADAKNAGVGEIAGLGAVEFPDDHPLNPKNRLN